MSLPQQLEAGQPVHPGHAQVEQDEIGLLLRCQRQYLLPARRRRHDFEVFRRFRERQSYRFDHQLMVVCYQNLQPPHGCLPHWFLPDPRTYVHRGGASSRSLEMVIRRVTTKN